MSRSYYLGLIFLCGQFGWAQQELEVGTVVPAGTLLHCTLDEPNFSSATAQVGDPVLCHVNSLEMFGRPLTARGAYLSARLQDYRDPGHFVGKGWLQLEFTSLTLPTGTFPLNAKVISAARYRVDREGKIRGKGHPTRDAIEWAIPILWPVKVLTLPARGPRPALKGETRIGLRLMEDVYLPDSKPRLSSRSSMSLPNRNDNDAGILPSRAGRMQQPAPPTTVIVTQPPRPTTVVVTQPPKPPTIVVRTQPSSFQNQPQLVGQRRPTVIALSSGTMYLVADYWVESGNLGYTIVDGGAETVPLEALDIAMTQRINAERGVPFVLSGR